MPTQCRLLDAPPPAEEMKPGDMWFAHWYMEYIDALGMSEFYMRDHRANRPPIIVVLPNGSCFCPDSVATNSPGWTVTGEAPNITVSPSILVGSYHGWLNDGILTD